MYFSQEQIDRANQADLVSFLQAQGEQLERAGNEYRWKRHDSLTVRGNKWYRHSQSKGGGPVDFLMEFFGKSFTEAVELLTGEKGAAPPPDSPAPLSDFRLPPRSPTAEQVKRYLTEARRIDEDVTGFFISSGDIYEEAAHHNAVFVGRDESGIPRYAHQRGTAGSFRLDVKGSDKAFNFCYRGEGERLFVFVRTSMMSTRTLWSDSACTTARIAFAVRPLRPMTRPMSSGLTRTRMSSPRAFSWDFTETSSGKSTMFLIRCSTAWASMITQLPQPALRPELPR